MLLASAILSERKRRFLFRLVVFVSACALLQTTAPAKAAAATRKAISFNFGTVCPLLTDQIEHTFIVTNTSTARLIIGDMPSSCGCTTAFESAKAGIDGSHLRFALEAGQSMPVTLTIHLQNLAPGPVDKFVYLIPNGQTAPAVVLEMTGTLLPAVSVTPTTIDFGDVPYGTQKSENVTVAFDPALLASAKSPDLVANGGDLTVSQISGGAAPIRGAVSQTYRVTLSSKTPAGVLSESLAWVEPANMTPSVGLVDAGGQELVQTRAAVVVPIPIAGDVIGAIVASPNELFLSTVQRDQGASANGQVTLTSRVATRLTGITAASDTPNVLVEIHKQTGSIYLNVTAQTGGNAGLSLSNIIIKSVSGEILTIPVKVMR
jgi:hypothetical protein